MREREERRVGDENFIRGRSFKISQSSNASKNLKAPKKSLNASNKFLLSICIAFKQFFMHL